MLKSNWRSIGAAIGCLIAAGILWAGLRPSEPVFSAYKNAEKQSPAYRAGGSQCDPMQLRRLSGTEAVTETNRCRESAEQHRLQSNDLIQQTRAADAAVAQAEIGYSQTLIVLCGTIIGFFTLAAAVLAALYAKKAAEAAEQSITHSRETSQKELKAYLAIEGETVKREDSGRKPFNVFFCIKNVGATPANDVEVEVTWLFRYNNRGLVDIAHHEFSPLTLTSGATSDVEYTFTLQPDENRAFRENKGYIAILVKASFQDNFDQHWVFRQTLTIRLDGVATGKVYTDNCEHVKTEEAKAAKPRRAKALKGPMPQV